MTNRDHRHKFPRVWEAPRIFSRGIKNIYFRYRSYSLEKRVAYWHSDKPVISFTFDDFPRSAYQVGGRILERFGVCGSFYASFGLRGTRTATGDMFKDDDLKGLLQSGHELGCHTYNHLDAWKTPAGLFEESIRKNISACENLIPGYSMRTFAYPRNNPHPKIKALAAWYFRASRGGRQMINEKTLDLNLIKSFFINYKNRNDPDFFLELIRRNAEDKHWLVFSTHDVDDVVSPHGCSRDVFEEIVAKSVESGALVLPVHEACRRFAR